MDGKIGGNNRLDGKIGGNNNLDGKKSDGIWNHVEQPINKARLFFGNIKIMTRSHLILL